MNERLARAETLAKLTHVEQGGWHSIRRKGASERRGYPIKDLMEAGGWSDQDTLLQYIHSDEAAMAEVVAKPTHRVRSKRST